MSRSTMRHGLNIGLWVVQLLLMAVFVLTGFVKVFQPIGVLAETYRLAIVNLFTRGRVR